MKSWFKRRLLPIALVAACGGLAQTVRQFIPRHKTETDIVRSLETGFPQDRPVPIDVRLMTGSSELLTSRDLRDQVRDWLLLTTLAASGMDPEKLNEVTFDLPPVRYGFMKPVADWEYGPLRSRAIGNGTVVALMPAGSGPRRTGYLCDIADQSRKSLGQMPA